MRALWKSLCTELGFQRLAACSRCCSNPNRFWKRIHLRFNYHHSPLLLLFLSIVCVFNQCDSFIFIYHCDWTVAIYHHFTTGFCLFLVLVATQGTNTCRNTAMDFDPKSLNMSNWVFKATVGWLVGGLYQELLAFIVIGGDFIINWNSRS